MDKIKHNGNTFYVDAIIRELSEKYDVSTYKGPMCALGEVNTELALGRFMFLSRMAGQFVGVDFKTYKTKFPDEDGTDSSRIIRTEDDLEAYARRAESDKMVRESPIRIERKFGKYGKKIYFPTEALIEEMILGIKPLLLYR